MRAWRASSVPRSQVRVRANQPGVAAHPGDDRVGDRVGGVPVGQVQQGEVAGHPLHDGADRGVGRLRAHHQVAFVVAGHQALHFGGPGADRDRADDLAARLAAAAPLPGPAPGPQGRGQVPFQPAARVNVDRLVDRLVADPHRRVVRVQHPQPPAGLLRRVPARQHLLDLGAQHRAPGQLNGLGRRCRSQASRCARSGWYAPVRGSALRSSSRPIVDADRPSGPRPAAGQAQPQQPGQLIPLLAVQVTRTVGNSRRTVHPAHLVMQPVGERQRHAGRPRRLRRVHPRRQVIQHLPHLLRRQLTPSHATPSPNRSGVATIP